MFKFYIISCSIAHHTTDATCRSVMLVKQIPTFILMASIQGIVSEAHAVEIAKAIVCPIDSDFEYVEVSLSVVGADVL